MDTPGDTAITPEAFKNTLSRFATGITVVTMREEGEIYGITVNAFLSVSLEPPLVLVSIAKNAKAHATLLESDRYGVSILSERQEPLSSHFAGWPTEGLEPSYTLIDGFPLLQGALAGLVCRTVDAHEVGDHTLFIGQVEHAFWSEEAPLLYHARTYGTFQPRQREPLLDG